MKQYYYLFIVCIILLIVWKYFTVRKQYERFWLSNEEIPFEKQSDKVKSKVQTQSGTQEIPTTSLKIPISSSWTSRLTNWINPNQMVSAEDCYTLLTKDQIRQIEQSVLEHFASPGEVDLPQGAKQVSPTFLVSPGGIKTEEVNGFLRKDKTIVIEPQEGTPTITGSHGLTPSDMESVQQLVSNQLDELVPVYTSNLRGEPGAPGQRGAMGQQGLRGPQGLRGLPGDAGPRGERGFPGALGPTGPQGAPGPRGEVGQPGVEGATGPQGQLGMMGPPGLKGDQGLRGHTGPQGLQGVTGPQGVAYVMNGIDPTDERWVAMRVGEPGSQGPQGEPGPTGAVGAQGAQGVMGMTGPAGPTGDVGPAGPEGKSGLSRIKDTIGLFFQGLMKEGDTVAPPEGENQSQIVNDAQQRKGLILRGNRMNPTGRRTIFMDEDVEVENNLRVKNDLLTQNRMGLSNQENTAGAYFQVATNGDQRFGTSAITRVQGGAISGNMALSEYPGDLVGLQAHTGFFDNGLSVGNGSGIYVNELENKSARFGTKITNSLGKTSFAGVEVKGQNAEKGVGSVRLQASGEQGQVELGHENGRGGVKVNPAGRMYVGEWDTATEPGVYDGLLNVKRLSGDETTVMHIASNFTDTADIQFTTNGSQTGSMGFRDGSFFVRNGSQPENEMRMNKRGQLGLGGLPEAQLHLIDAQPSIRLSRPGELDKGAEMSVNPTTGAFSIRDRRSQSGMTVNEGKFGFNNPNPNATVDIQGNLAVRKGGLLVGDSGLMVRQEAPKGQDPEKTKVYAKFGGASGNLGLGVSKDVEPNAMLSFGRGETASKINLQDTGDVMYPGIGSTGNDVFMHTRNEEGSFQVFDGANRQKNLLTLTGKGRFGIRSQDGKPKGDFCIDNTCINKKDMYEFVLSNKQFVGADMGKGFLELSGSATVPLRTIPPVRSTWNPFLVGGGCSWLCWLKVGEQQAVANPSCILVRRDAPTTMGVGLLKGGYVYGFVGATDSSDFLTLSSQALMKNVKSWKSAKTVVDYAKGTTTGDVIQVGVVFLRLDDNVVMKMYVNGLFQWQYTIPFNPEWNLMPGDLYYGSNWNESQTQIKVGMASFFGLPLSGDDMNQMYWLQRDNLKFT